MKRAILGMTAAVLIAFTSNAAHALTDDQKMDAQAELKKMVQQRQGEMLEQKQIFESNLKHEDDDAASASHKLSDQLKLARYWLERRQGEGADAAEIKRREGEVAQLEDQKKQQQAADAERKADHKKQKQEMEQKTAQQKEDLEAAQTRFNAAILSDTTNDYDHALGVALAAYGDPHWKPETTTECHTANGVTDCKTGYNK